MAFPFLWAAFAIATGLYGIKRGVDAKNDYKDTEHFVNLAESEATEANEELESQQESTDEALEKYGQCKKKCLDYLNQFDALICYPDGERRGNQLQGGKKFAETYPKIIITREEEIDILKALHIINGDSNFESANEEVRAQNIEISSMITALQSITGGSLAGLAVAGGSYFGVMALGTASTGTAIGSLSGAAATNATLAWLGGGSLASGGAGVAGGTAVLGGVVVGPALAIAGTIMATNASKKKDEAYSNLQRVRIGIKKLKVITSRLSVIERYSSECHNTLAELLNYWSKKPLKALQSYADRNITFKDLTLEEREVVFANYAFYYTIYEFVKQPIVSERGDRVLERPKRLAESKLEDEIRKKYISATV